MKTKLFLPLLAFMALSFNACDKKDEPLVPTEINRCGDNLTWDLTDGVLTISGSGDMYNYNDSNVVPWKNQCDSITTIIINKGATSIGNYAFEGCRKLASATIPNSVTCIGWGAFYKCQKLTSIEIPNSVTDIDQLAFSGCGLISVAIPNSVSIISDFTFSGCGQLTSITIPHSVISIGNQAFHACISLPVKNNLRYADACVVEAFNKTLQSYDIEQGTIWIGGGAFRECSNLTSITIPNGVKSIGTSAFEDCTNLTSITIPNSVTNIGEYAFSGCTSLPIIDNCRYADTYLVGAVDKTLQSYNIEQGTIWIGVSAFRGCSNLTSITIPNSVKSIESCAFYECSDLTSITIPNSVKSIEYQAFSRCSSVTSVTCLATTPPDMKITYSGEGVFSDLDCSQIPLYVPVESVAAYSAADQWKDFNPILPIP